ncbi:MAG: LPS export ABC transporter permease LptG [Betaproteobacteria bacterium]|nr:LPS export ABC transporter permease LptG [Betaproteobacteria bacterium]
MRIIVRYLTVQILSSSLFVFAALTTLFALFDLINELDSLGKGAYGFWHILLYVGLNVPGHLYELLPVAALIGSLLALARLVSNSEFTIMLASGLSMRRIAVYMMLIGLLFSALTFVFGEIIAPATDRYAEQMKLRATHKLVAQAFRSGLWVRDHNQFVNVREVSPDGGLRDVSVYVFDPQFHLQRIFRAASGQFLHDNLWQLSGLDETDFLQNGVQVRHGPATVWQSVLTPAIMNVLLVAPEKMSAQDLWAYVAHLHANHQPSERYEIALWSKLVYPLAAPVMLLLAIPFAWHRPRAGSVSTRVFAGIMVGLSFHLFNRLFAYIGLLNGWQPWISVSLPTLLFLAVGVGLLLRVERQ